MGLAWTFMGASVGYQIFAGLLELAGGYLLFWRRTTLAGALVSAGVLTNVMAFNYFFDVPVKLFSTHLFLVALFIMARDLPQLAGVLGFGSPVSLHKERPFWWRPGRRAVLVPVVHLLFVGALTAANVSNNLTLVRATGVFDDPSPLSGIYRVTSFVRDGVANRGNEDSVRWVRVGLNPPFYAAVLRATGDVARMRIAINEEDGTLSFFAHEQRAPETPMFTLTKLDPDVLRLEGKFFDGAPMVVVMRKEPTDSPLTSRGFRWINEVPFSR